MSKATRYIIERNGSIADRLHKNLDEAKNYAEAHFEFGDTIKIYRCELAATAVVPNKVEWK